MTATSEATATPSTQQARRITCDWFRSPVTDYLNVSSVVYPRGAKVSLQELDETNALVNVVYWRHNATQYFPKGRLQEDAVITLSVYGNDFKDADEHSSVFDMITINNKALIDAIRPALASVYSISAEKSDDHLKLVAPYPELFFAQGRILETLKHGGLGSAKDKLLRAFVTVMNLILRKTNHTVREMAGQRTIDYDHTWTLFPLGSIVAHEVEQVTHLFQTVHASKDAIAINPDNKILPRPPKEQWVFDFTSYGFDGYNFGMFNDAWKVHKFDGQVSVSSLQYRPLKFEERYNDPLLTKKAIEKGRKSLEYQSYHHCQYAGKVFPIESRESLEQIEINGRVVVDCLKARTNAPDRWTFYYHTEPKICPVPAKKQEIFSAMRSFYLKSNTRRPNPAEQEKRKQFFLAHDEYLMLIKPLLPAWSLEHNDWFWLDVSNLEPISFEPNPLGQLVLENERSINLINKLIDTKFKNAKANENNNRQASKQIGRKNLLIQFAGGAGTGKTATAAAIAEHHQCPLIRLGLGDIPLDPNDMKQEFFIILGLAQEWQAILVMDTAAAFFDRKSHYYGHDLSRLIETFGGVGIFIRRDHEKLLDDILKQYQINLQFGAFTPEKREKIWRLMVERAKSQIGEEVKSLLNEETIKTVSSWELNGHDMRNLFENALLLWQAGNGNEPLKMEDLEDLKAITCQPQVVTAAKDDEESRGRKIQK